MSKAYTLFIFNKSGNMIIKYFEDGEPRENFDAAIASAEVYFLGGCRTIIQNMGETVWDSEREVVMA